MSLRPLAFLSALPILFFAGALLGKVTQKKPLYNQKDIPQNQECEESKPAFSHATHLGFAGGSCTKCHVPVTSENALPGEELREIRRPDHSVCLGCHADHPGRASFFEKEDAKRIICQSCHVPRLDETGRPIQGSENEMAFAPGQLDYSSPLQKPCDITYGFDFSHAAHTGPSRNANCSQCHTTLSDKGAPSDGQMVSTPNHPDCFRCHAKNADKNAAARASVDDCVSCHSRKGSPDVKRSYTSGGREDWAIKFVHKTHLASMESLAPTEEKRCVVCHQGVAKSTSAFFGSDDAPRDKVLSSNCFCCHYEKSEIAFGTASCTKCHAKVSIPVAPPSHRRETCTW